MPDLYKCRSEVGSTNNASEILPGFLWIGDASSSKRLTINNLGITLVINCTSNMKNLAAEVNIFRCRDGPIPEKPKKSLSQQEKADIFDTLEKVYDWIEFERISPDKAKLIDIAPSELGNFNPGKRESKKISALKRQTSTKDNFSAKVPAIITKPTSRVLLWSRLGTDRACFVAAAYLIKSYGLQASSAVDLIAHHRAKVAISPQYLNLLDVWSARYTLGVTVCVDCAEAVTQPLSSRNRGAGGESLQRLMDGNALVLSHNDQDLNARYSHFEETFCSTSPSIKTNLSNPIRYTCDGIDILSELNDMPVSHWLTKIPTGFSLTGSWSGLLDLQLAGRGLSDDSLAGLFDSMAECSLCKQLRCVDLQRNLIQHRTVRALLAGLFPVSGVSTPDDYFFDDQLRIKDVEQDMNLMHLDLSYNELNELGVRFLTYLLRLCNTVSWLSIEGNQLGDALCADFLVCLQKPSTPFLDFPISNSSSSVVQSKFSLEKLTSFKSLGPSRPATSSSVNSKLGSTSAAAIFQDEEELLDVTQQLLHNSSLTDLRLGLNHLAEAAAEALAEVLQSNAVLGCVCLQLSDEIPPEQIFKLCASVRLGNPFMQELCLAETPLTVGCVEAYLQMAACCSQLRRIDLHNCRLRHMHLRNVSKWLLSCSGLRHLDLHHNPLGDKAAGLLAQLLAGDAPCEEENEQKEVKEEKRAPPRLTYLDLSGCGLGKVGAGLIAEALAAGGHPLKTLDLSGNHLGCDCSNFLVSLSKCGISELRLAECGLQSAGASHLFQLLSQPLPLTSSLRALLLGENGISDSATPSLCALLQDNFTLQLLDLGFNDFSSHSAGPLQQACKVSSDSSMARKVLGLTMNLLGNPCEAHMQDTPALARAKTAFLWGTKPSRVFPQAGGFGHIAARARGPFLVQKLLSDQFHADTPPRPINSLF